MLPERRGVLEAFYGRPWSWSERHAMLDFMHEVGFNAYLYAPKNDPVHRNRWQEPYTATEWAAFGRLAAHAHAGGTEFIFGLSALAFCYSDAAHLALLQTKLRAAQAQGIRSFALLLDDIPSHFENSGDLAVFPDLARAQAWLANTLLQDIGPGGELYFCPTEYHGGGNSAYLWALGSALDLRVQVLWTGLEVCSRTICAADLRGVTDALRRTPVIWDNFPVNDLDMQPDLHIAPLTGRTPDLLAATAGYFAAPGALAAASRVALRTTAAYLHDPQGYDPAGAFRDSVRASTATPDEAAALTFLADLARRTPLIAAEQGLHHALWPAIDAFWAARGGPPPQAGPELPGRPPPQPVTPDEAPLRTVVCEMERHAETLIHLSDPALRADLVPWAAKLAGWGRVLRCALGALDHPQDVRARESVLEELPLVRENFHWVGGDTFDAFARRCVWAAEMLAGVGAPEPGVNTGPTALADTARAQAERTVLGNGSPIGLLGSSTAYKQVWARDSMICSLGLMLCGDPQGHQIARQSIRTLAAYQSRLGNIPHNVGFTGIPDPALIAHGGALHVGEGALDCRGGQRPRRLHRQQPVVHHRQLLRPPDGQ